MLREQTGIVTNLTGSWVLGHNQRESGSELFAGARAQLLSSRLTHSLSTLNGRIAARTMLLMAHTDDRVQNYAAFRTYGMMEVTRRVLYQVPSPSPVVLNPVAGYSPAYIWLAEEMPDVYFIDMDSPEVNQYKQTRLSWCSLPENLSFKAADLSVTPLHEALSGLRPDVVVALAAFSTVDDFAHLLRYLRHVMVEGGWVIAPFPYAPGIEHLSRNVTMFQRFAGKPRGLVHDIEHIHRILDVAGYHNIDVFKMSQLAQDLQMPQPADVEVIAMAQARPLDDRDSD